MTCALGRAEPDAAVDGGRDADFAALAKVGHSAGARVQVCRVPSGIVWTNLLP